MELQLVEEALLVPIKPLVVVMVATLFFLQSPQTEAVPVALVVAVRTKDKVVVLVAGRQVTPVLNSPVVTELVGKATPVVLD
jgi:hypothetical protein